MIQKICVYCVEGILFGVTWVILDKNVWHGNHSALASFCMEFLFILVQE